MGKQKNYIVRRLFGEKVIQDESELEQDTPKNINWDEIFLRSRIPQPEFIEDNKTESY